jgi:hypothetical protein
MPLQPASMDAQFKKVKGWAKFAISVYHPLLRTTVCLGELFLPVMRLKGTGPQATEDMGSESTGNYSLLLAQLSRAVELRFKAKFNPNTVIGDGGKYILLIKNSWGNPFITRLSY